MRLFKKLVKNYLFFGFGVIFGSIVATFVSYTIFSVTHGSPSAAKILQIQECLEEKLSHEKTLN